MDKNKSLAVLAFVGVLVIVCGNFVFQNQPWLATYWVVSDIYSGALLLVLGYRLL